MRITQYNYNTGQAPTSRRLEGRRKPCQVFIHLQGLGSYQLADYLVNETNQEDPCYIGECNKSNVLLLSGSITLALLFRCPVFESSDSRIISWTILLHSSLSKSQAMLSGQPYKTLMVFKLVYSVASKVMVHHCIGLTRLLNQKAENPQPTSSCAADQTIHNGLELFLRFYKKILPIFKITYMDFFYDEIIIRRIK